MVNQFGKPDVMCKYFYFIILFILCFLKAEANTSFQESVFVKTEQELKEAISAANPGTTIIMKNGYWRDIQIQFTGEGTANLPIVLKAEKAGEVIISGKSNLTLGGNYLIVDGLYFKEGYTPSTSVIQFKASDSLIANNVTVTNCVIENYTQLDRDTKDHWVEFWGRNNSLRHCYISGKSNTGPTIRVFLKGNEHIKNNHQIVYNYFGPRPRKGGPHGETMQIGDSYTSMTPSYTNVSNNIFDRCNGEVEIISSKSNFNIFRNNVFYESEGSLVLRHGNYATIDANVFIGNDNSSNIGGIRVINTGHWITNNYFYKLKGEEFRAPLAVMNGIPKSPLNRYNQVTDVVVAYNTWVDCAIPWSFGVGSNVDQSEVLPPSEIRSARAERMVLANNFIYSEQSYPILKLYDSIDGVRFKKNYFGGNANDITPRPGIETTSITIEKKAPLLFMPTERLHTLYNGFDFEQITSDLFGNLRERQNNAGAIITSAKVEKPLVDFSVYGPAWYDPPLRTNVLKSITVSNSNELVQALRSVDSGVHIDLEEGIYTLNESLIIDRPITLKAKSPNKKVVLNFDSEGQPAFRMYPQGTLTLDGLTVNGTATQDALQTLEENMSSAYNVIITNSKLANFKSILNSSKSSFADTIKISKSSFKNFKQGIQLANETDDTGEYNAEYVIIEDSKFEQIEESVIDYYRGGYDESTIGGNLIITGSTFKDSAFSDSEKLLFKNRGIVHLRIEQNTFENNDVAFIAILWGEKGQKPVANTVVNSGEFQVIQNLEQKLMY